MALFIGIDLGTSGVRAMAIDETRAIRGQSAVALPPPITDGSKVEQDPEIWWAAVCECLAALSSQIDTSDVAAIAVDGTSATLLLTDAHGTPLGPALMYNDARAVSQADRIAQTAPSNTAAQGPSCTLAKLLWLYEQKQNKQASHALHQADSIAARLAGLTSTPVTDINNALKLGFDAERHQWPNWQLDLLAEQKIPTHVLPEVVAPGTVIGTLSNENAQNFGLPKTTRIVAGTTDSTASFLATGAREIGEAVTALGSTLVIKIIADKPVFAPEYGVYSQPLVLDGKQHWLVGGASNSGGAVLRQFFSLDQLNEMTPHLKPETPSGLDYYPLPAIGERFPVSDPDFKPQLEPRPENDVLFFQGILEGIARIEAQAYRLLAELGAPYPVSVRSTGGGAHNPAWTRMREQCLQTIIKPAAQTEAAFGSALLAKQSKKT